MFVSLCNGLGRKPEDVADVKLAGSVSFGGTLYRPSADVLQLVFSSRVLFLSSHYLAKLSVLYLLRRLFARDEKHTALICDVTMGITALSGLSSFLLDTVNCSSQTILVEHCHDQVSPENICHFKSLLTTSSDHSLEHHYRTRRHKTGIHPHFAIMPGVASSDASGNETTCDRSLCLPTCVSLVPYWKGLWLTYHSIIALSAAHLKVWISYSSNQASPFEIAPTMILQQTLLAASLISATIPT